MIIPSPLVMMMMIIINVQRVVDHVYTLETSRGVWGRAKLRVYNKVLL
jgi:hypothetical protein